MRGDFCGLVFKVSQHNGPDKWFAMNNEHRQQKKHTKTGHKTWIHFIIMLMFFSLFHYFKGATIHSGRFNFAAGLLLTFGLA